MTKHKSPYVLYGEAVEILVTAGITDEETIIELTAKIMFSFRQGTGLAYSEARRIVQDALTKERT